MEPVVDEVCTEVRQVAMRGGDVEEAFARVIRLTDHRRPIVEAALLRCRQRCEAHPTHTAERAVRMLERCLETGAFGPPMR